MDSATLFLNGVPVQTKAITPSTTNSTVTFDPQPLTMGSNTFTVQYGGDGNYFLSTSPSQTVTIPLNSTTTTLSSSLNPSAVGQTVTLMATVAALDSGSPPTGVVEFFDGTTSIGSALLSGSKATINTSFSTVGNHSLTAFYFGDPNSSPSSNSFTQTVDSSAVPTTTALTSSPNPSVEGQVVTLGVMVTSSTGGTPSGTVQFFDGTTLLGTGTLSGGMATLAVSTFAVGVHPLRATYSGSLDFNPSPSQTIMQIIYPNPINPVNPVNPVNPITATILPPTHIRAKQVKNQFASQTEFVNVVKFRKPLSGPVPVTYLIYRDQAFTHFVKKLEAYGKLRFSDHNRHPHVTYTYYIVSIDARGNVSAPAIIRVKAIKSHSSP